VGDRLVAGLSERVATWRTEAVDRPAEQAAALLSAVHRAEWRVRHLVPDRAAVRSANLTRIAMNPGDLQAWAGISAGADPDEPLRASPELVRAVHAALRDREVDVDPEAVSLWLTGVLPSPAGPVRHDDLLDPPELGRG
jgi:hypothetical protein